MNTIQTGNNRGFVLSVVELVARTPAPAIPGSISSPLPSGSIGANQATPAQPSQFEIKQALDRANKVLESTSSANQLEFSIHDATGMNIVKLVDQQTGETIRQFPSKEILAIAEALDQHQNGAVVKQKI